MVTLENIIALIFIFTTLLLLGYERYLINAIKLGKLSTIALIIFDRILFIAALLFLIKQGADFYHISTLELLKLDLGIMFLSVVIAVLGRNFLMQHIANFSENKILLKQVRWLSIAAIFILLALGAVNTLNVDKAYQLFLLSILMFFVVLVISLYVKERIIAHLDKNKIDKTIVVFASRLFFIVMFLIYFVFVLQIFNISTAPILTVLGAASLALGLSLQNSLSNLAAGILLIIFRPYRLGNIIQINNQSGTVDDINFLFTTLRTFTGESLNIPNSQFLTAPGISNFTRCKFRRVEVKIGIDYGMDVTKAIQTGLKHFEESVVVLKNPAPRAYIGDFGASSIDLVFWFYLKPKDYSEFNYAARGNILDAFKQNGIEIPFNRLVVDINREQQ